MSATTAVTELLRTLVQGILRDPAEAEAYSQNPAEYLAAHGVVDHDLAEVDMRPIIVEVAKDCDLPEPAMVRIVDYGRGEPSRPPAAQATTMDSGPPRQAAPDPAPAAEAAPMAPARTIEAPPVEPPVGMSPLQAIEQHLSYVTYVTYESNTSVVQNLIDNRSYIDNRSNVSFEVGGSVYGDIDMTNEVTNTNATGEGAVAAGGDMVGSNVNTGSGDINDVGTINANDSAVAVGGNATNTQDRSVDNSSTDNSVDNSTIDNSRNTNVEINDSFNDNSTTDNSVDVDVNLGRGRSGDRMDDPGFGRGETGYDREPGGEAYDMPGTRDGTPEQYDEKYGQDDGQSNGVAGHDDYGAGTGPPEGAHAEFDPGEPSPAPAAQAAPMDLGPPRKAAPDPAPTMQEQADYDMAAQQPMEPIVPEAAEPMRDVDMPADETGMMD